MCVIVCIGSVSTALTMVAAVSGLGKGGSWFPASGFSSAIHNTIFAFLGGGSAVLLESASSTLSSCPPTAGTAADDSETFVFFVYRGCWRDIVTSVSRGHRTDEAPTAAALSGDSAGMLFRRQRLPLLRPHRLPLLRLLQGVDTSYEDGVAIDVVPSPVKNTDDGIASPKAPKEAPSNDRYIFLLHASLQLWPGLVGTRCEFGRSEALPA